MNAKKRISAQTVVRYIRDFSIVVAGIAVTLYVNDKVTNQGEKRDLRLYLNAIKLELEENLKTVDMAAEMLKPTIKYSEYIRSLPKKSLNKDTLNNYAMIVYPLNAYTFTANAFEMFKSSGTMRLIEDKDLLQSLWEVYDRFTILKELIDWNFQTKWEDMKKELSQIDFGVNVGLIEPPLYLYHAIGLPEGLLLAFEETAEKTKGMISKL
ncbi:MAG: hypothetical protein LBC84_10340 [Prevotellaceae bacterium]|jgi:hypothetical protein|nr:hypothetical protein [Prevotellaceae bacterium]